MYKSGTGGIEFNLKSGGADSITATSGNGFTFQLNDLPDRSPTGPLALYLTHLTVTLQYAITQAGGTGVAIPRDRLPSLLFDSFDWTNSWMGPVLQKTHINGARMPVAEYVAGGFKYGQRQGNRIPAANGTYNDSISIKIPALNDKRGRLCKETSHLAALFQPSQIRVALQPLSVLTTFSPGASLASMSLRVTAHLEPRQELVMGTPMEWILHTPISGGPQVTIEGFGRDAAMNGVHNKGGVAFLMNLSTLNGFGGVVTPSSFTDYSFPWRGQGMTYDMKSYLQQFIDLLPSDRPQILLAADKAAGNALSDFQSFPYIQQNVVTTTDFNVDLTNLLGWIMVMGGEDLDLSDLQSADSDQTFNLTQTGGFAGGNHQILAQYARCWTDAKKQDWIAQVTRGGDASLANLVLGGRANVKAALARAAAQPGGLGRRMPTTKHVVTPDQFTFLPFQLV